MDIKKLIKKVALLPLSYCDMRLQLLLDGEASSHWSNFAGVFAGSKAALL